MAVCAKDKKERTIVALRDGTKVSVKTRRAPYRCDLAGDRKIRSAVETATASHFTRGNPVARYDLKTRSTYWEYPDGTTQYAN